MKYKRLHRVCVSKANKFFKTFDSLVQEYGEEEVWYEFKDTKVKYDEIKHHILLGKFGLHLIEKIDLYRRTYKVGISQIMGLVYRPHIDKLVPNVSLLTKLIGFEESSSFNQPVILDNHHGVTYKK